MKLCVIRHMSAAASENVASTYLTDDTADCSIRGGYNSPSAT
jgi:hypothetical protein